MRSGQYAPSRVAQPPRTNCSCTLGASPGRDPEAVPSTIRPDQPCFAFEFIASHMRVWEAKGDRRAFPLAIFAGSPVSLYSLAALHETFAHSPAPVACLLHVLVEDKAAIGAAKTERIGHDTLHFTLVSRRQYVHALRLVYEVDDVGRLSEETFVEHNE